MKKRIGLFLTALALLILLGALPVSAASLRNTISSKKSIACYTKKSSGKVYGYEYSTLKKKKGYIECAKDQCYIQFFLGNAVLVKYPIPGGWKQAWFKRSDFTGYDLNKLNKINYTAPKKITTYRRSSGKTYGYISKGDKCYVLSASGSMTQVIYPVKNGYKMAWVKTKDLKKSTSSTKPSTTSSKWQLPMKGAKCSWRNGGANMSWGARNSAKSGSRQYHLALDLKGSSSNIYAAAAGTVAATGYNSANGRYVIIKHTVSGKTVYSFYAHMKSITSGIKKNKKVSKGQKIGVMGSTGSAASGAHLHFSVVNKLSSNGGYYGYATKFSGNKKTYGGKTFYNPLYIIKNGKLP